MNLTLWHVPPSFYSQVARLGLTEKGVRFKRRIAAAGPPFFDTYKPDYLRMNPGGTVPTLVIDGEAVPDSRLILGILDERFEGAPLVPDDEQERAEMERWLELGYSVPVRVLTYGAPSMRRFGAFANKLRAHALERGGKKHPELREVYEAKLADIEGFAHDAVTPETVAEEQRKLEALFDDLDEALRDRPFVAGERYSLADVLWTVMVARTLAAGFSDSLENRPSLAAWWQRVRARPSFEAADVWDRFRVTALVKMVGTRAWKHLLVLVALLSGTTWAVVEWLT